MSTTSTIYDTYKKEWETAEGREEWENDANFGAIMSKCTGTLSGLVFGAGLINLGNNRYVDGFMKLAGAAGLVASYDWSVIAENESIMLTNAKAGNKNFLTSPENFAKALWKGTWTRPLFESRYVRDLKAESE